MDPYEHIVQLYNLEHDALEDDLTFLANLIQEGPVLEVGCGTGRIVERLARAGLEVHGIDTSEPMLKGAAKRLEGVTNAHLHRMSVLDLNLPTTFRSAVWPLNVLWHLPSLQTQTQALQAVRAHMCTGGLLVIDLSNPLTMVDRQGRNQVRRRFHGTDGPDRVDGFSCAEDNEAEQVLELIVWYDRTEVDGAVRRTSTTIPLRYTYRFELELMLERAGFRVAQIYGTYDLDPYSSDSRNLLVVGTAL